MRCAVAARRVQVAFVGDHVHAARCFVLPHLHDAAGHRLLRALSVVPRGRRGRHRPRPARRRPRLASVRRLLEREDRRRGDRTVAQVDDGPDARVDDEPTPDRVGGALVVVGDGRVPLGERQIERVADGYIGLSHYACNFYIYLHTARTDTARGWED